MKKLVEGIVDFRKRIQPGYREMFAHLALGQKPDCLFIACSDSRVVPNLFASSDPGDLFVLRNVGNLMPPCGGEGVTESDESEWAAVEFAIEELKVPDIVVCGHSECGAMGALLGGRGKVALPHLRSWLRHAEPALADLPKSSLGEGLSDQNRLSQLNVLRQMEHLLTYPVVRARYEAGSLRIHGWWFDISHADVYSYNGTQGRFMLLDEEECRRVLARMGK